MQCKLKLDFLVGTPKSVIQSKMMSCSAAYLLEWMFTASESSAVLNETTGWV